MEDLCNMHQRSKKESYAYHYEYEGKGRHISVVPWKSMGKKEEEVPEKIARQRWYDEKKDYDDAMEVQTIAPTVPDTQTQPTQNDGKISDNGRRGKVLQEFLL